MSVTPPVLVRVSTPLPSDSPIQHDVTVSVPLLERHRRASPRRARCRSRCCVSARLVGPAVCQCPERVRVAPTHARVVMLPRRYSRSPRPRGGIRTCRRLHRRGPDAATASRRGSTTRKRPRRREHAISSVADRPPSRRRRRSWVVDVRRSALPSDAARERATSDRRQRALRENDARDCSFTSARSRAPARRPRAPVRPIRES